MFLIVMTSFIFFSSSSSPLIFFQIWIDLFAMNSILIDTHSCVSIDLGRKKCWVIFMVYVKITHNHLANENIYNDLYCCCCSKENRDLVRVSIIIRCGLCHHFSKYFVLTRSNLTVEILLSNPSSFLSFLFYSVSNQTQLSLFFQSMRKFLSIV